MGGGIFLPLADLAGGWLGLAVLQPRGEVPQTAAPALRGSTSAALAAGNEARQVAQLVSEQDQRAARERDSELGRQSSFASPRHLEEVKRRVLASFVRGGVSVLASPGHCRVVARIPFRTFR